MSPASSGALEVERYIGACLISSQQSRHKKHYVNSNHQDVLYQPNFMDYRLQRCNSGERWAGGMPLISFSNHQRCWSNHNHHQHDQQGTPLSRLAVHTQGVPLILSNNKYRKNKGRNALSAKPEVKKQEVCTDAVSVASDESSGSANSDNCLPRIIKPRKRRKKDRKPPHLLRSISGGSQEDQFSTESPSPDIDFNPINSSPITPFPYNPYKTYEAKGVQIPSNQTSGDISETPKLHHSFEDIEEIATDLNGNVEETLCQCRYCDPSGQIWDIDRSCYSPFLTTPPFQFPETPKRYPRSPIPDTFIDTLSAFSLEEVGAKIQKSRKNLEVSTEIVTSLNGHRDLEIKFFSSTNPGAHKRLFDSNSEGDLKRLFSTSSSCSDEDRNSLFSDGDLKKLSSNYNGDHKSLCSPSKSSDGDLKKLLNSSSKYNGDHNIPCSPSNSSDGDLKKLLNSSSNYNGDHKSLCSPSSKSSDGDLKKLVNSSSNYNGDHKTLCSPSSNSSDGDLNSLFSPSTNRSDGDLKSLFSPSKNRSDGDFKSLFSPSANCSDGDLKRLLTSSKRSDGNHKSLLFSSSSNRSDGDLKRLLSSSSSSSSVSNGSDDKCEQADYLLINKCPGYAEPEE